MPILEVRLIGPTPGEGDPGLSRRIADAAAAVLDSRPQGTWVTVHRVPADDYAENEGGPPAGARPVIVSVLLADRPPGAALADLAGRLATAIAGACSRPIENVHLIFEPAARGRVAFGGRLVR